MKGRKPLSPGAVEAQQRREREDGAKRLADEVPLLTSLRLEIEEKRAGASASVRHVKIVVVSHAPALIDLPCGDPSCRNGGYELTYEVLRSLRARETEFQVVSRCDGQVGSASCSSEIRIAARAAYAK
jgi:hypothetical protein